MAGGTFFRRRLVEQHRIPVDKLGELVALGTAYVLVRSRQWKLCPPVMVE